MKTLRALSVLMAAVMTAGCGYTLVGRASNLPEDIKKVYIEPLQNGTTRPQVEQILTQAISDELLTRRRFEVVNTAEDADAILRGSVDRFGVRALTFNSQGLVDRFEISITANMKFQRATASGGDEPEIVWENARYVFREDYPVEDEGGVYFDRENIAIEETAERFAETLLTDLLEGF